jgi:hypothetical protein
MGILGEAGIPQQKARNTNELCSLYTAKRPENHPSHFDLIFNKLAARDMKSSTDAD